MPQARHASNASAWRRPCVAVGRCDLGVGVCHAGAGVEVVQIDGRVAPVIPDHGLEAHAEGLARGQQVGVDPQLAEDLCG